MFTKIKIRTAAVMLDTLFKICKIDTIWAYTSAMMLTEDKIRSRKAAVMLVKMQIWAVTAATWLDKLCKMCKIWVCTVAPSFKTIAIRSRIATTLIYNIDKIKTCKNVGLQRQNRRDSTRDRHDCIVAQRDLQGQEQDFQEPHRDLIMQDCTVVDQDLRDTDLDRIVRSWNDVHHMHSRWQRVVFLMHDKWSADEDIMSRWQLVAKLVNARMNVYDPQVRVSKWGRLGFQMRKRECRWNVWQIEWNLSSQCTSTPLFG